ncbi:NAD(P)H-dependent oxidoreductase [Streptococcus macacae]|uniref:General stress protein 14 n=1 Tax=Streptococcus macacae NCTC 11558 TaxID=764298 RepID=G5JUQ9_9STRE|nr:NAD(P)H-dependent oxidoreductase [Streptococcus macacae]EHJ53236.1 general stress protein 14 [Streptococcus macacae NCTC 11558]
MKTTLLVFHPNIQKSRVNKRLAQAAEEAGLEVRYLYQLYPDGKIDVKKEQAILEAADRIVLQFPMYWYSSPALLKQWEDQVLEYGWAYGSTGTALQGKEFLIAVSPGASLDSYRKNGRFGFTIDELLAPFHASSNHIGTRFLPPFVTAGTLNLSDEELEKQAAAYVDYLLK